MTHLCRIGDSITGTCNASATGHPRTFMGTWTTGSTTVFADGIGVVRVGDTGITDCSHPIVANTGSAISTADGLAIVRVGDAVSLPLGGSGNTTTGSSVIDSV